MPTGDWRARFAAERILGFKVARNDRSRVVLVVQSDGAITLNRWRPATPRASSTGIVTDGTSDSWWPAADGRSVFTLVDDAGDEHGHVHRVDLGGGGSTDLTPGWAPYTLRDGDAVGDDAVFAAVDADGFHLVHVPGGGPARRVRTFADEAWRPRLSGDGRLATLDTTDHNPGVRRFAVTAFDLSDGRPVGRLIEPGGDVTAVCWSPVAGDRRVLVDRAPAPGGWRRPALWTPSTGQLVDLPIDRPDETDVVAFDWSDDADAVLVGFEHRARQRVAVHHHRDARTVFVPAAPGSHWSDGVRRPAFGRGTSVLTGREDAATPLRPALWHDGTQPSGPIERRGPTARTATSVTFPSADGTPVQAWWLTPTAEGPHPTVVHVHGGPHWVSPDRYDPVAQAWLDHGFGWLDVNYRGSTGRGAGFAEQIHGDIGRLELDDLAAAHAWLVRQGCAPPDRIALTGASYGGFLTLYALGRQPDLWAAGMASVAMADWVAGYADASPALRAAMRAWFGGSPQRVGRLYRERSPITYVASVAAPVVVVQAEHDSRTTPAQLRTYAAAMAAHGKRCDVVWLDGGHGVGGTADAVRTFEAFLAVAPS